MSRRDIVLGKVRRALAAPADDSERTKAVADRLAARKAALIPARGQLDHDGQIDLFCEMAEKVQASTVRVASADDVPEAIAAYLRDHNLPASLRMGADERLGGLAWDRTPHLERLPGASDGRDMVGLSHAFGGVAETGTLILTSGADNPTSVNFLPDTHIIVIDGKDVDGDYETVWTRLRQVHGTDALPRTVNMITGPSRSGDIEQTLLLGAHGPRSLHIILVEPG
jgi:L-lactate dehydrogenase complex protein LldG